MTDANGADIAYRVPWRSGAMRSGAHRSRFSGTSGQHRGVVSLLENPDPRRIAIRESLRDPFEQVLVRSSEQLSTIQIAVLIDVSASMSFVGRARKIALACDIASAISDSAGRYGDPCAILAFDNKLRWDLSIHVSRARSARAAVLENLRKFEPSARGMEGAIEAASLLSGSRKLVFVISDFLWDVGATADIARALGHHDVIAIALDDSRQLDDLPEWGLLNLVDHETGRRSLVVMRPSLKAAWRSAIRTRRNSINECFSQAGRSILEMRDRIDWERLMTHVMYGSVP